MTRLVSFSALLVLGAACGGSDDATTPAATSGGSAGQTASAAGKGGARAAGSTTNPTPGGHANGGSTNGGSAGATSGGSTSGGAAPGGHANGGSTSGGSTNGGAAGGAVTPTVSSWVGTNVSGDLTRVDVTYQLAPFDTDPSQLDDDGYPKAGQSGKSSTDIGFVLPTGTYSLAWKGEGTLSISGIGALQGTPTTVNGEHRVGLAITGTPGAFGNFLTLQIQNGAGQQVTGVRLLYPGHDYDEGATFLPEFLRDLRPFRTLRFMDWLATNGSKLASWADRPAAHRFGHSANGEPYEHVAALVNETGKDAWVTIPELADDAFVTSYAQFLAQNLDFAKIAAARAAAGQTSPFELIVEEANETWNGGFSAKATFLAIANQDAATFDGPYSGDYQSFMTDDADLRKVARVEADRLARHAQIFRTAFPGHEDAIAPVLSGWALGAGYSDVGLQFLQAHHGDPKTIVRYVAMAPYFATDDAHADSMADVFAGMEADIASKDATYAEFAKLVAAYGVKIAAYEGGQSLTGTASQPVKHLAQHDARMYATYVDYLKLWRKHFDDALFVHFDLAGTPGTPEFIFQYGYWGSLGGVLVDPATCGQSLPTLAGTEDVGSVANFCPKYRALMEQVP